MWFDLEKLSPQFSASALAKSLQIFSTKKLESQHLISRVKELKESFSPRDLCFLLDTEIDPKILVFEMVRRFDLSLKIDVKFVTLFLKKISFKKNLEFLEKKILLKKILKHFEKYRIEYKIENLSQLCSGISELNSEVNENFGIPENFVTEIISEFNWKFGEVFENRIKFVKDTDPILWISEVQNFAADFCNKQKNSELKHFFKVTKKFILRNFEKGTYSWNLQNLRKLYFFAVFVEDEKLLKRIMEQVFCDSQFSFSEEQLENFDLILKKTIELEKFEFVETSLEIFIDFVLKNLKLSHKYYFSFIISIANLGFLQNYKFPPNFLDFFEANNILK